VLLVEDISGRRLADAKWEFLAGARGGRIQGQ
jgi:hypothetical protein